MRHLIAAVALAAISTNACGGGGAEPRAPGPVGTWTLTAVNGSPVPYSWQRGDTTRTIASATLHFGHAGDVEFTVATRFERGSLPVNGVDRGAGSWSQQGTAITVESWFRGSGTVTAEQLEITGQPYGFTYRFTR